ncbi:unnamed protein product [Cyprideis torosa]|uniref:Uncharacterized protein n=1 Tax=Cyprideis torosa TaxID=163714 RepID=A0A7R8WEI7_9CRUS|nr:unnamed protein product [Cyprideis torosa]CAG0895843.1 unnamed protein product [Cyprideis torosa]
MSGSSGYVANTSLWNKPPYDTDASFDEHSRLLSTAREEFCDSNCKPTSAFLGDLLPRLSQGKQGATGFGGNGPLDLSYMSEAQEYPPTRRNNEVDPELLSNEFRNSRQTAKANSGKIRGSILCPEFFCFGRESEAARIQNINSEVPKGGKGNETIYTADTVVSGKKTQPSGYGRVCSIPSFFHTAFPPSECTPNDEAPEEQWEQQETTAPAGLATKWDPMSFSPKLDSEQLDYSTHYDETQDRLTNEPIKGDDVKRDLIVMARQFSEKLRVATLKF